MPVALTDVRCREQSGHHLLAVSISGFDPERTCGPDLDQSDAGRLSEGFSAQCNTVLLFKNSMTPCSTVAGRSCNVTTVATIFSCDRTISHDLPASSTRFPPKYLKIKVLPVRRSTSSSTRNLPNGRRDVWNAEEVVSRRRPNALFDVGTHAHQPAIQ
jgi:hypothetical protein